MEVSNQTEAVLSATRWRRRPRLPRRVLRVVQERLYGRDPRWVDVWLRTSHLFCVSPTAVVEFGWLVQAYERGVWAADDELDRLCEWAEPEILALEQKSYEGDLAAGIPAEDLNPPTRDDIDCIGCITHACIYGVESLKQWKVLEECFVERANRWSNGRTYRESIGYALATDLRTLWVRPQHVTAPPPGPLPAAEVLARDGHRCRYCGEPADTVDHIFPATRGGPQELWNLAAACRQCNSIKRDRTPAEAGMVLRQVPTGGGRIVREEVL